MKLSKLNKNVQTVPRTTPQIFYLQVQCLRSHGEHNSQCFPFVILNLF